MTTQTKRIFKRKIYSEMLKWKEESKGKYALLIEGARRVGKSTIAEEFAKNEYQDYLIIDFSKVNKDLLSVFEYTYDLNQFYLRLFTFTGRTLPQKESVIIFDEVQLYPKARQAIKHLVADARYDFIETGSLISIKRNVKDILIPSEEHRLSMYPMDFEEFLLNTGKPASFEAIKYGFTNLQPLGEALNRSLLREFRLYMLVGGMPQAVAEYLDTYDFSRVDYVKREIINLYYDDFRKIDSTGKVSTIFKSIPSQLSRNTLNYQIGNVMKDSRPSRLGELFTDLNDSKTVIFSYRSNDPSVGLGLHANHEKFRIYMADTGLFVTLALQDGHLLENEIYKKLMADKLPINLGYFFENIVAQMLTSSGHSLYFYNFGKTGEEENSSTQYEIDFIIRDGKKICPIEVKSSGYKTHKSIDEFKKKYSSRISKSYLLYTKDLHKEGDIICLPVYMAALL